MTLVPGLVSAAMLWDTVEDCDAILAGLNAEGGSRNLSYSPLPTESSLSEHLRLTWRARPAWPTAGSVLSKGGFQPT
jgi:hypothetical protein